MVGHDDPTYPEFLLLIEAAGFCAKLAAVEHAHILGDQETVDLLLAGVDPIDARLTANTLYALAQLRGGSISGPIGTPQAPSPAATSGASPSHSRATAPNYPHLGSSQVTHIGDNWSKKVPCE